MSNIYVCENCGKEFTRNKKFLDNENILCHGCKISESVKKKSLENPNYQKEKLEKRKTTCNEKYGCDNVSKRKDVKEKISSKLNDAYSKNKDNIIEKRKKTNKSLYDFEWASQNTEITKKGIETQRQRNNGYCGFENKEFQKKCEILANTEESKNKKKETYIKRTGYDHVKHNPNVESSKKGYFYDNKHFDSSWELAYYIWLNDNKIEFLYHPPFYLDYKDDDNKSHKYQPDFLINGKFYEIKGNQFFNEKGEPYNCYEKSFWWNKYKALTENNIIILRESYMRQYLVYVKEKYGKNYLKSFKTQK